MVRISDELMRCAKEYEKTNNIHFSYFCLMSGQDYLLKDTASIHEELLKNYPEPYIDCTPCAKGNWVYNGSNHSAWWILPDMMVDYVLETAKKFGPENKFYPLTGVGIPEENYYQTVLMDSEFKNQIRVNPPEMVAQNCKTYANFSSDGKPFAGHPYILTMEDTDRLAELAKNRFFARKFDETVDSNIFDWIDENLLCDKD